jgi:hypothetical protein
MEKWTFIIRSYGSSVSIVTVWSTVFSPVSILCHSLQMESGIQSNLLCNGYPVALSKVVRRLGREAHHLHPLSDKAKNGEAINIVTYFWLRD